MADEEKLAEVFDGYEFKYSFRVIDTEKRVSLLVCEDNGFYIVKVGRLLVAGGLDKVETLRNALHHVDSVDDFQAVTQLLQRAIAVS